MAPTRSRQNEEPKFPTINIVMQQMIKSLLLLRTKGAEPIVLQAVAL
jgi:hypothetical protein